MAEPNPPASTLDITVGEYLFKRLSQLGIKSIFGVPGDYELALLDFISPTLTGLTWRGNPNELNAGYAADGYARTNGVGAVVTTFGPGELSNMCPIAGAYAEFVPVVHIVGYPTEAAQKGTNIMHHSLGEVGDGKFDVYHQMSKHITVDSTVLHDEKTAPAEIDRCLNAMMFYSQPVYIGIPTDIALKMISPAPLAMPLRTKLPPNDSVLQTKVVNVIIERLKAAKNPVIIVDGLTTRNRLIPQALQLIELTKLPYFVTAMGKGSVPESLPTFGGVYTGSASYESVTRAVEGSDVVLFLGNYPSDFNTAEFTEHINPEAIIDFQRFFVKFGQHTRYNVKMEYVLEELITTLSSNEIELATKTVTWNPYPTDDILDVPHLTQDYLWAALGKFFNSSDLVIAETGTSAFGIGASSLIHIKPGSPAHIFNQTIFGSIGFATGAAVGAFVASSELGLYKRHILITGEGSLQLTVQAFADLIRHAETDGGVKPLVFVLNNDGYTVERLIHGMSAEYNKVPNWDYGGLWQDFAPGVKSKYVLVKTPQELDAVLGDAEIVGVVPTIVELILDKWDAPASVKMATKKVEEFNHRKGKA